VTKILKIYKYPFCTIFLLLQTLLLLIIIQLCVRVFSLQSLIKLFSLQRNPPASKQELPVAAKAHLNKIEWAIVTVRREFPFMHLTRCLAQALTARLLLKKRGIKTVLFIGATMRDRKKLEAHAWLSCGTTLMNFGAGNQEYTELIKFY